LAGINLNQSLGSMAFGLYGSQEQVVICDEFARQIKHVLRGFVVDDETLAVDVIREAGHGGSFLGADHTVRHFRRELYFPFLFQRKTIDQWLHSGSKMSHEIAHERVQEILAAAGPVPLPAALDAALEQALNAAVAETKSMAGRS
jgi:trimethylamine---corrinoid protein Co-methyltransferase